VADAEIHAHPLRRASFSYRQNNWDFCPAISVEVSVRDIERIPEASILTNRPPNRCHSSSAVTGNSMPEFDLAPVLAVAFRIFESEQFEDCSSITFP
jgi:hypothetical protein